VAHAVLSEQVREAQRAAIGYYRRGWNPLPSRPDKKMPWLSHYAEWLSQPIDPAILDRWWAPNVQVVCGVAFGVCVVDVDGPFATRVWAQMILHRGLPDTWQVQTRRGCHYWFACDGLTRLPKRWLWRGWDRARERWEPGEGIELIGDRFLAMAPPSVHPSGVRYAWIPGHGPSEIPWPAPLPDWIRRLRSPVAPTTLVVSSVHPGSRAPRAQAPGLPRKVAPVFLCAEEKTRLARDWGLRVLSGPNQAGWISCRAIDRVDRHPSARFHAESGRYMDMTSGVNLGFCDLAVALGAFPSARAAWLATVIQNGAPS
jgi:hypothetical protein